MITALIIYRTKDGKIRRVEKRTGEKAQFKHAVADFNAEHRTAPNEMAAEYIEIAPDGVEAWLVDDRATRVRNFRTELNEIVASVDALDSTMRDIERRLEKEDAE